MRIATGGISHETSTFSKFPTRYRDFETDYGVYRDQEIIKRFRGTNICTGGFIDGAEKHGFELVPLLWAFAYPNGLIVRQDYEALKEEFLERLRSAERAGGPVDGALLDLHGAMIVEGIDDGDGDFIAAVRDVLGPDRPIVVTQDLHGNHTQRRVDVADIIVGYDTYPHVDMRERGREAADLIVGTLDGDFIPTMAMRKLPLIWSASLQVTAQPPMDEVMRKAHSLEERAGIVCVTVSTAFPYADVPEVGASVIVVTDNNWELAQSTADELGAWIWEHRQRWYVRPPQVREAIAAGEELGKYPIVLADEGDNTGGGTPGDSTEVLETFLDLKLNDAVVLYIVDPEVAQQAHAAGAGATIAVSLGGKSDPMQGPPVEGEFEVVAVTDGAFTYDGPMFAGLTSDMGRSAWLRQDGVSAVVVTARQQPFDTAFARTLGIDVKAMRYVCVKSAAHFRSGFGPIAGSIFNVNARCFHAADYKELTFRRPAEAPFPVGSPPNPFTASPRS